MALLSVGGGVALGQSSGGVSSGGTGGTGGSGGSGGHSYVFPVKAKHRYGDGIGAGRGHQGQDILARCGAPVVAVHTGRIRIRAHQSAAGYYLVLNPKGSSQEFAFMHLRRRHIRVHKGDHVTTGQRLADVGRTGDATACHLHFENRAAPGFWGGRVINPTRKLRRWDKYS